MSSNCVMIDLCSASHFIASSLSQRPGANLKLFLYPERLVTGSEDGLIGLRESHAGMSVFLKGSHHHELIKKAGVKLSQSADGGMILLGMMEIYCHRDLIE